MSKRVIFTRVPNGTRVQGVFNASTAFIKEGSPCNPNEGGGFVGRMEMEHGLLYIRKVDEHGKPCRNFGKVSMGEGKIVDLMADGICVSAEGYALMFNDEVEAPKPERIETPAQDPPPAKPIQNQGQQNRR